MICINHLQRYNKKARLQNSLAFFCCFLLDARHIALIDKHWSRISACKRYVDVAGIVAVLFRHFINV